MTKRAYNKRPNPAIEEIRGMIPGATPPPPQPAGRSARMQPQEIHALSLEMTEEEIDQVMSYLINTNAGVKVFLLLDKKIGEARMRRAAEPGGLPTAAN